MNSNSKVKEEIRLKGLSCTDCAAKVEKTVGKIPGVFESHVNFAASKITVEYPKGNATLKREILKTIEKLGYLDEEPAEKNPQETVWWKQQKSVFLFIAALITGVTILLEYLHVGLSEDAFNILYGIAIVIGGYYPARDALSALRNFTLNINTLLIFGALGAVSLSLWEEAAGLVVIFSLGEVLEAYAVEKTRGSIRALVALTPKEATVIRNGKEIKLSTDDIQVGDIIIVKPGEKIPVDGVIIAGDSAVDQSSITGESIPVEKTKGSEVYASTINGRGSIEIEVTRLAKDTTLAKIIHLVEEAQTEKGTAQRFSEKFGKYYTPIMFVLAITMATVPPLLFGQPFNEWLYRGLVILVVSCSCSLVLSVPVSIVAGIGNAARSGVLVKGGVYMEQAGRLSVIAFDKTGTLTNGKPEVTDIVPVSGINEKEVLSIAGSLETRSEHPLAEAILRETKNKQLVLSPVEGFEAITGKGAKGKVNDKTYYIGNPRLFESISVELGQFRSNFERLQGEGKTVICVGDENNVLGLIAVADQPKPEAKEAILGLKKLGIRKIVMLTGDNEGTAKAIASQLGIDEYRAELLPEDKINAVKELQKQYGMVGMVGDGVNDTPALAQADLGIAMGAAGTDVALETADMALMTDRLEQLVYAIRLSRLTVRTIKQNIGFSLAVVAFLVVTALAGWLSLVTGLLLNEGSALVIIANGVRLLKAGKKLKFD